MIWLISVTVIVSALVIYFIRENRKANIIQFLMTVLSSFLAFLFAIEAWKYQKRIEVSKQVEGLLNASIVEIESKRSYVDIILSKKLYHHHTITVALDFRNPMSRVLDNGELFSALSSRLQGNLGSLIERNPMMLESMKEGWNDTISLVKSLNNYKVFLDMQKSQFELELALREGRLDEDMFEYTSDSLLRNNFIEFSRNEFPNVDVTDSVALDSLINALGEYSD